MLLLYVNKTAFKKGTSTIVIISVASFMFRLGHMLSGICANMPLGSANMC